MDSFLKGLHSQRPFLVVSETSYIEEEIKAKSLSTYGDLNTFYKAI